MIKQETFEYELLQHIKMCIECNNESQAIRLLEKYGFEKQEGRYSEEEIYNLLDTLWDRLDRWYNETEDNEFNLRKWFDECELKKK